MILKLYNKKEISYYDETETINFRMQAENSSIIFSIFDDRNISYFITRIFTQIPESYILSMKLDPMLLILDSIYWSEKKTVNNKKLYPNINIISEKGMTIKIIKNKVIINNVTCS
jgi:hypothetical protein